MFLNHFTAKEFGEWYDHMDPLFLTHLDYWRALIGFRVMISPAPGALGRPYGRKSSQHYFDRSSPRKLRVADVMPYIDSRFGAKPLNLSQMRECFRAAKYYFNGIGVYPDWLPVPGFHLDIREPLEFNKVYIWSGIKVGRRTRYGPVSAAWERFQHVGKNTD